MNEGDVVQQMQMVAGGSPTYNMMIMRPPNSSSHHHHHHHYIVTDDHAASSWDIDSNSHLLHVMNHHNSNGSSSSCGVDVNSATTYGGPVGNLEFQLPVTNCWSHHQMLSSASSPNSSCITTLTNHMLHFSPKSSHGKHPHQHLSSQCNSSAAGGAAKKPRTQSASSQSTFKVRKEKLGDRITALHQLVSPFGKTDTASVLLEAIGYIKFLQSQIEALSLPYLGSGSGSGTSRQQHPVQGERNCLFPEDPGQLLNEKCIKRKGNISYLESDEEPKKDLRSRGLCVVPISCTLDVGNENGADYWASAFGANFG